MADLRRGVVSETFDPNVSRALISVHGIVPPPLVVGPERFVITNALRAAGNKVIEKLYNTTKTWKEHKVTFLRQIHFTAGEARVNVFPSGDVGSVNIWNYLNTGTSERWAVMSKDWKSKTKPGRMTAQAGAGHVVMRGRRAMLAAGYDGPKPGIEAREWTQHDRIIEVGIKELEKRVNKALVDYVHHKMWAGSSEIIAGPGGIDTTVKTTFEA